MESLTFPALGGDCELYAIGADAAALTEAQAWIARMHDRLTRFESHSEVSRLNASGGSFWANSGKRSRKRPGRLGCSAIRRSVSALSRWASMDTAVIGFP